MEVVPESFGQEVSMTQLATIIATITLVTGVFAQGTKPQVKPGAKPQTAKSATALQGTWAISSINGEAATESNELKLTFDGNKYHQTLGGTVNERGTFKVDTTKKPMTIDLSIMEGDDAGKTQLGILEVTGDTMRCTFNPPGSTERPASLTEGAIVVAAKKSKS
jgi:uncharacterized protein (TIGR03067 family)